MTIEEKDTLRQLLEDITYCLHHHEVDTWRDCPGTDRERMTTALQHAREALGLVEGKLKNYEVREDLAHRIACRDLAASGGIVNAG